MNVTIALIWDKSQYHVFLSSPTEIIVVKEVDQMTCKELTSLIEIAKTYAKKTMERADDITYYHKGPFDNETKEVAIEELLIANVIVEV